LENEGIKAERAAGESMRMEIVIVSQYNLELCFAPNAGQKIPTTINTAKNVAQP
jgi:hypothetical protein